VVDVFFLIKKDKMLPVKTHLGTFWAKIAAFIEEEEKRGETFDSDYCSMSKFVWDRCCPCIVWC